MSGYVDPFGYVLERHPCLGVDEGHVSDALSYRVEDNFLVSDVVVLFVGKGRRSAGVRLIRGVSVAGFGSSRSKKDKISPDPPIDVAEVRWLVVGAPW